LCGLKDVHFGGWLTGCVSASRQKESHLPWGKMLINAMVINVGLLSHFTLVSCIRKGT